MNADVTLVAIVHDPDDRLYDLSERYMPEASHLYREVIAFCSPSTSGSMRRLLGQLSALPMSDPDGSTGAEWLGRVRRDAVKAGLQAGAEAIHLCDYDRLLHWQMSYPEELAAVVRELPSSDFMLMGRSQRAFLTHPDYQVDTETLSNRVFFLAVGQAWDLSGGSRGLSRRAAEYVVEHSVEPHFDVDAEWPILIMSRPGMQLTYRVCEGLEFETADRYPEEIAAVGGIQAWRPLGSRSPDEWLRRLQYACWTAEAVSRTMTRVDTRGEARDPGSDVAGEGSG